MHIRLILIVLLALLLMTAAEQSANAQVRALSSALVQVDGSASPIMLASTRDADVTFSTARGGLVKVRFDKLHDPGGNPINTLNNKVEMELIVNGGAAQMHHIFFAIVDGFAQVELPLGLSRNDVVETRRIDIFDDNNIRFATLGVRIQSPRP
jgi:hypothetical protein